MRTTRRSHLRRTKRGVSGVRQHQMYIRNGIVFDPKIPDSSPFDYDYDDNKKNKAAYMRSRTKRKPYAEIVVDNADAKSMTSAEKQKARLENQGYTLVKTKQIGFNKFMLQYKK